MITATKTEFGTANVEAIWPEIYPLFVKHWEEIAHYKNIPLEPDYEKYKEIEKVGMLRIFTAREDGKLIGYCVYFINHNLHYKSTIQALQDVLFVQKEKRGFGMKFIKWCDEQLKNEGVNVVHQHIKKAHNFGPMLERIGYELVDLIYARRLI